MSARIDPVEIKVCERQNTHYSQASELLNSCWHERNKGAELCRDTGFLERVEVAVPGPFLCTHSIHAHENLPSVNDIPPERFLLPVQFCRVLMFQFNGPADDVIMEVNVIAADTAIQ